MNQLNQELAEQLKDAGFPQKKSYYGPFLTKEGAAKIAKQLRGGGAIIIPSDDPYIPSLSELIEECGDEFLSLARRGTIHDKKWLAYRQNYPRYDVAEFNDRGERVGTQTLGILKGSTPEEAVAMLYLSLHGKTRTPVEGG